MLKSIGFESLDELVKSTVPANILQSDDMKLQAPMSESEALGALR